MYCSWLPAGGVVHRGSPNVRSANEPIYLMLANTASRITRMGGIHWSGVP
jgi:hypothetical protein